MHLQQANIVGMNFIFEIQIILQIPNCYCWISAKIFLRLNARRASHRYLFNRRVWNFVVV